MENYKPVLRISVKPEKFILFYIIVAALLGFFVAIFTDYFLFLSIALAALTCLVLRKYYFLSSSQAVIGLQIEENQQSLTIETKLNRQLAKVVDAVQFRRCLMLYVVVAKHDKSSNRIVVRFWRSLCEELYLFIGAKRILICVSENSTGPEKFRQLLRWVHRTT